MYKISYTLPANREPWNIPVENRRKLLLQAKKQGKQIALLLYHHADTSTFRYRGYNLQQATQDSDCWQCVYFFMDELQTLREVLPLASVLVLVRLKWEHVLDDVVLHARSLHIPVLFDVDDLVCSTKHLPLVTNTLNVHFGGEEDYDFWFAYCSRIEYVARMADGFITTNDFLGGRLQELEKKPYRIIRNSMNQEQLKISAQCRTRKQESCWGEPYTLGYFSGTPSHINDFKMIYQEMMALLMDFPKMKLSVVGFMEFPEAMRPLLDQRRITFTPLVDFMELQRLIAQVDVNLVPLVNNTFTNCKSELKFFEASAVNTVTVATPTYAYRAAIRDGETGYLCAPGQWYDCIKNLYLNREQAAEVAAAGREYCLQTYAGERFVREIEQAYQFFVK